MAFVLKPPYACRMERLEGERIPRSEGGEEEVGTYEEFHAKKSRGIVYVYVGEPFFALLCQNQTSRHCLGAEIFRRILHVFHSSGVPSRRNDC